MKTRSCNMRRSVRLEEAFSLLVCLVAGEKPLHTYGVCNFFRIL